MPDLEDGESTKNIFTKKNSSVCLEIFSSSDEDEEEEDKNKDEVDKYESINITKPNKLIEEISSCDLENVNEIKASTSSNGICDLNEDTRDIIPSFKNLENVDLEIENNNRSKTQEYFEDLVDTMAKV